MPFIVVTDHAALRALQTKESLDGCLQSYAKKLLGLDFDIQYCLGSKNFMPYLLLRVLFFTGLQDACLPGELEESEVAAQMNHIWVPPPKRKQILRDSHIWWGGNLRFKKLYKAITARFWWHNLCWGVQETVDAYRLCTQFALAKTRYLLCPIKTRHPFKLVAIETSHVALPSEQKECFLVVVDYFANWIEVCAIARKASAAIAKFVWENIILQHGCPKRIFTDNGALYASLAC